MADAFTGDYIKDGEVDILSTDSTFLCKGRWTYSDSNGKIEASLVAGKLPNNNKYILRLTHKDYVTTYYALSLRLPKRSGDFYYPTEKILMRKLPMRQKERTLGEAVVTAAAFACPADFSEWTDGTGGRVRVKVIGNTLKIKVRTGLCVVIR